MRFLTFILLLSLQLRVDAQHSALISNNDLQYLESLTRAVLDSARIHRGQVISKDFGPNKTGGTLVRPGGRDSYPSFWIRDYAMSLETGFVSRAEQLHMLTLTASTQCDQTFITQGGSMVPMGAIADHIRIDDGLPIYFPGTYDVSSQGDKTFGMFPPYCDQFFFIQMAYEYIRQGGNIAVLTTRINGVQLIDRLLMAFHAVPTNGKNALVYTTSDYRGVDFGFRDIISMTGQLCMPSILKFNACKHLGDLLARLKQNEKAQHFLSLHKQLMQDIPAVFADTNGMLRASTGLSRQRDVWSTVLAIHSNILSPTLARKAAETLRDAYTSGTLSRNGNIRHIISTDDFNETTAWEKSLAGKGSYQNGGYWGTPVGWVCESIATIDRKVAKALAADYVRDLRLNDFRHGAGFGAPWECYNEDGRQNPVYLTTVSCPLVVFRKPALQ